MEMKNQRRNFIKNTITGMISTSLAGILPGFILNGCKLKTDKGQKIMNNLIIKEIKHNGVADLELAEKMLESHARIEKIETVNWPEYSYMPEVNFKIAYCQDQIWLKYYVTEESIMAKETKVNGDVYKDSCVEFFISTKMNDTYYNFEFNCIGIPHVGYHRVGKTNALVDSEILKSIKVRSSLGNQPFEEKTGGHQWEMMIVIPKECLAYDKDIYLKGLKAKANFYKCGNETSKPHYLSWNPIGTKNPDFHQPEYFGEILFE